jgi:hypothetical protein
MSWLSSLPHQIPFRAASSARRTSDTTIEGRFLCTANDRLATELMVLEAMAQVAGGLAFQGSRAHGFLTGVDHWEIDRSIEPGEVVTLVVTLDVSFGGTYRFSGRGTIGGVECVRGRFYLAGPNEET